MPRPTLDPETAAAASDALLRTRIDARLGPDASLDPDRVPARLAKVDRHVDAVARAGTGAPRRLGGRPVTYAGVAIVGGVARPIAGTIDGMPAELYVQRAAETH